MSDTVCTHSVLAKVPRHKLRRYGFTNPDVIYQCEECRAWLCVNVTRMNIPYQKASTTNHA